MEIYKKIVRPALLVIIAISFGLVFMRYINKRSEPKPSLSTDMPQQKNIVSLKNSFQEEVIKKKGPVVVIFSATWCPSCVNMKEIISTAASKLSKISFIMIDVDEFSALATEQGVQSIPAYLFFDKGKIVSRTTGFMDEEKFIQTIKSSFEIN
jgi:thioredoxin-like negative regulator of GroEL